MEGSGIIVIRALLLAEPTVTSLVSAANIQADILPPDTALPALLLQEISSAPFNTLRRGPTKFFRDRVQVTPLVRNYDELLLIRKAVFKACADKFPNAPGLVNVSVIHDGDGPDGYDPNTMARMKPMDFIVRYNSTA